MSDTKTELTLVTSEYSWTESVQILRCHLFYLTIYLAEKSNKQKRLICMLWGGDCYILNIFLSSVMVWQAIVNKYNTVIHTGIFFKFWWSNFIYRVIHKGRDFWEDGKKFIYRLFPYIHDSLKLEVRFVLWKNKLLNDKIQDRRLFNLKIIVFIKL